MHEFIIFNQHMLLYLQLDAGLTQILFLTDLSAFLHEDQVQTLKVFMLILYVNLAVLNLLALHFGLEVVFSV